MREWGYSADERITLRLYSTPHRQWLNFGFLRPFGQHFAEGVAGAVSIGVSTVSWSTGYDRFRILRRFFRWILEEQATHPELVCQVREDFERVPRSQWTSVVHRWHAWEGARNVKRSSLGNYTKTFNRAWQDLHSAGLVPAIVINPPKNYRRSGRSKRTVAEVSLAPLPASYGPVLDTILARLPAADRENPQTRDFLAVLLQQSGSIPSDQESIAEELIRILHERIDALRATAETHLESAYRRFKTGEELIATNLHRVSEIRTTLRVDRKMVRPLISPNSKNREAANEMLVNGGREQGLANLLVFIDAELMRNVPRRFAEGYRQGYSDYCQLFGGIKEVNSYLSPDAVTLVAALVIILVETRWNVTSGRELKTDCLHESPSSGYKEISTRKERAGGDKQIRVEVAVKDMRWKLSVPKAVSMVLEMTAHLRPDAPEHLKDVLFVFRAAGTGQTDRGVLALNEYTARQAFYRLQGTTSSDTARYSLDMIRPSQLLATAYAESGDVLLTQVLADHRSAQETSGYVDRFPVRVQHERQIRKFQELLQIILIYQHTDAVERLGLTRADAANLFSEAHRTGLGIACRNPFGGIQSGTSPGELCTSVEECPECPMRFVLATVSNMADMILWNAYLKLKQEEMLALRPARWMEVWMPWLAFTEATLQQMRRGPALRILQEAEEFAQQRLDSGRVNFPPLM